MLVLSNRGRRTFPRHPKPPQPPQPLIVPGSRRLLSSCFKRDSKTGLIVSKRKKRKTELPTPEPVWMTISPDSSDDRDHDRNCDHDRVDMIHDCQVVCQVVQHQNSTIVEPIVVDDLHEPDLYDSNGSEIVSISSRRPLQCHVPVLWMRSRPFCKSNQHLQQQKLQFKVDGLS